MSAAVVVGGSCLCLQVGRGLKSTSRRSSVHTPARFPSALQGLLGLGLEVASRFRSPWDEANGQPARVSVRNSEKNQLLGLSFPGLISPTPKPLWKPHPGSAEPAWAGDQSIPPSVAPWQDGRALSLMTVTAIRCHKSIRSLLFLGR